MKKLLVILTFAGLALATPADTKKKTAPAKTAPASPFLTIPKGAVQDADGNYAFTDKQGKKWLYRQTPFGVVRKPDAGESPAAAKASEFSGQSVKVTDAGDTVKFERQSPFGPAKWEKKKSDLTDDEKALLQQQSPQPQPAPPAAQPE